MEKTIGAYLCSRDDETTRKTESYYSGLALRIDLYRDHTSAAYLRLDPPFF